MVQPVHGRVAGGPLPSQQPQQQPAAPQPAAPQQQQQGPPLSLLIGVAVQAALYWQPDDPARPSWSTEAQKALQDWLGAMPVSV